MKKITAFVFLLMFFANAAKAQYVNIPDSNFRTFLKSRYPNCFNSAGMMDTTCSKIISDTSISFLAPVNVPPIFDLDGLQYFKSLKYCDFSDNYITKIPKLPQTLISLQISNNDISELPQLPQGLQKLYCYGNKLDSLPLLPQSLSNLEISYNRFIHLPIMPSSLKNLFCSGNKISLLPQLNDSLELLDFSNNEFTQFPNLPKFLKYLVCGGDYYSFIDNLPETLISFQLVSTSPTCLSRLPKKLRYFSANWYSAISCMPNFPDSCSYYVCSFNCPQIPPVGICNPTNNPNHCQAFPQIQSNIFIDNNSNGIKDSNEIYKQNVKVQLSNSNYAYTKSNGQFQIIADSLGTCTLTIIPPAFYTAVPSTINLNFNSYDTLVNLPDIALKPNTLIDSVSIKATPINWAARPGFAYPYLIQYENVGTTILSPSINFSYDNSLLTYDSSNNNLVTNNGSSLSLNTGNLLPGQTGSFIDYFKVKTTAALGTDLLSVANINGGTSNVVDSVKTVIRGSYDPNDKQATPKLTKQDVTDGKYINYTIRFQNTGTDTAFNVVITDTLNSMLEVNDFQVVSSSHICKTTITGNMIYFEFTDINLPDSGSNKFGSNGFINFKIKPKSSVSIGTIITNKAYIYFDYNTSIKTNVATTTIVNPLPLKLVLFSAIDNENNNLLVYWNTVNEVNTAYFILEKSTDGNQFFPIAEIAAKGSGNNSYFYTTPKNGKQFLRLKIVDKDGAVSYSKIVFIDARSNQHIIVSPNPAKRYLNITANSTNPSNAKAQLLNSIGLVVKSFVLKSGFQSIDINDLATGVYYLQTGLETIKIFVEK